MQILVVDDEQDQRDMLSGFLRRNGHTVLQAANGETALGLYRQHSIDAVLLDQKMPGLSGAQTLARLREINPQIKVIMITAHGAIATAVDAMKLGALDFMEKPVDLKHLLQTLEDIAEQELIRQDVASIDAPAGQSLPFPVIGRGPAVHQVLSILRRAAPHAWPVLLRGETGTGKELFARLVHALSTRHDQPFVEVNCAAIPETLFEAELFGHEKGAFTGADRTREGRFEEAHGGTLFLDEIGELPLLLQAKLLRALQEQKIQRVGSNQSRPVDVRVIAASNRNLLERVQQQHFREDLYYRLNVFEVEIPPLRQRKEDIPDLIDFFLKKYGMQSYRFAAATLDQLMKYDFPGNVRELEHLVQRTTALSRHRDIQISDLPAEVRHHQRDSGAGTSLTERVADFEKQMLQNALDDHQGVQVKAARALGISERVLRYKLRKYGLEKDSDGANSR
mgnify:CR=1 FL=1